ncbi:MAG: SAM-dependent methyltransferase, partial [Cyanobacteria bacterium CAN_BIN43]|nr:SAM-dependent methyltransferase [Cyanobacteria bacterium CAN_BIN43]
MQINLEQSRKYLKQFQLQSLFVEELGWDNYSASPLSLLIGGKTYTLSAVAEKRGQVVYTCLAEDGAIPIANIRTKIHKEACCYTLENILVYIDQAQTEQVWQWVRHDPGKPKVNRFHQFHKSQSGDALLQKLEALAVSFNEEEQLNLVDVTRRTRRAFDLDRVTKKFYERFKKEHGLLLKFIVGIDSQFDQEWYCSVMLNRLMFIYFIQKKGFLDGNTDYLHDRLQSCQKLQGQDSFHSFYRYFLLKLFHDGLGSPQRTP